MITHVNQMFLVELNRLERQIYSKYENFPWVYYLFSDLMTSKEQNVFSSFAHQKKIIRKIYHSQRNILELMILETEIEVHRSILVCLVL